jgi:hypothetical protein
MHPSVSVTAPVLEAYLPEGQFIVEHEVSLPSNDYLPAGQISHPSVSD